MDLQLTGKTALISGSSKGIGLSIAKYLHKEGCNVVLNGRHSIILKEISNSLGSRSSYFVADVTKTIECTKLVKHTIDNSESIDKLIKEKLSNWDITRLAIIDKSLSSIVLKVSEVSVPTFFVAW